MGGSYYLYEKKFELLADKMSGSPDDCCLGSLLSFTPSPYGDVVSFM